MGWTYGKKVYNDGSRYEGNFYDGLRHGEGIYYYTTYENSQITKIDIRKENIQKSELIRYPFRYKGEIFEEN